MWVIILEALLALAMLVFIVWWTMFQGRGPKRRPAVTPPADPPAATAADSPPAAAPERRDGA